MACTAGQKPGVAEQPGSGKLRQRKKNIADDDDDDDALLSSAAGTGICTPKQRLIFVILAVIQVGLLVGFAYVAKLKKQVAEEKDQAVVVLSEATLPAFVAEHPDGALVNFHKPGCSHCEKLAPEFEAAARELKAKGGAPLGSVNVASAPLAAARHAVERYPTMLWFREGEPVLEVSHTIRSATKLVEYVEWAGQPAVVEFEKRSELEEAVPQLRASLHKLAPPVVVGFNISEATRSSLQSTAERSRGKTVFLFIKEAAVDDPHFRAIFRDAAHDQDFNSTPDSEAVHRWVKGLLSRRPKKESKA